MKKLMGFRTDKLWVKILASCYYLFCITYFIMLIIKIPSFEVNTYDLIIYKLSLAINGLAFLVPAIVISNFKYKQKLPILKNKKWWSDIFGFIITFVLMLCLSSIVSLFHSKDYQDKYEQFYKTKVLYKNLLEENKIASKDDSNTSNQPENGNNSQVSSNTLMKVHFIDVGQGDSIFIELPDKKTMLIDAGEASYGQTVESYIKKLGYLKINYIVGTHPHTDHIGGLAYIISKFEVEKVFMSPKTSTSKTYVNLLNVINEMGLSANYLSAGNNIIDTDNLKVSILAPNKEYTDANNNSIVIKIVYNNNKFLFMGDAEKTSENDILSDVSADVIKIGHHGSDTSSSENFVNRVKAKYVIISVGKDNQYNHPNSVVLDRWIASGASIYRTDINGNIIVISDGNEIKIN